MMKKCKWRNLYIGEIKISNPEEEIIYNVPKNDKIIEALVEIYKKKSEAPDDINEDEDDSTEPVIISANEAWKLSMLFYCNKKILKNN